MPFVIPYVAVRLRLQLAKIYSSLADEATAQHLISEIDDIRLHRSALGALDDEVSAFRRILRSRTQTKVSGAHPMTAAELRLLPYLQTHLTFREIGESPVRVSQYRQLRGDLDLSKAGRVLP